ncbi:hypothetical protein GINT2_001872 [Glugoides intestinalis]
MQNRMFFRNSILLGILTCVYCYIGKRAVINRNRQKLEYNAKKAEKDTFCKYAMNDFEVCKANGLESHTITAFTSILKTASLKKLKYLIISENYRLLLRFSIILLKFSFVFLRMINSEIPLGEILHRTFQLNSHLLQLRNNLFVLFEYWKECDFKEKKLISNGGPDELVPDKILSSMAILPTPIILRKNLTTLIVSKYKIANILLSSLGFKSMKCEEMKYNIIIEGLPFNSSNIESLVSFMPGTQYIFSNSIAYNLLYGTVISKAQLEEKLTFLDFLSYFNQFPYGLETFINSKPIGISSGQRQMICFLRCALKDASFYIFDEPTLFLDKETEKKVYNIIGSIKDSTVIVLSKTNNYSGCFDNIIILDA